MNSAERLHEPLPDGPHRFFMVLRSGAALTEAEADCLLIGRLAGLCRGAGVTPPASLITLWSERHRAMTDERNER